MSARTQMNESEVKRTPVNREEIIWNGAEII
jgi:hypothetical protein